MIWRCIKKALAQFSTDECMTLAAALAYYTLFAMPPLLFLLVMVLSTGMSVAFEESQAKQQAQQFVQQQAAHLIGNEAAAAEVANILENVTKHPGNWWKSILSLIGVLFGATGVVAALQSALNRVWRVKRITGSFARQIIFKRLFSLAMILGFGFLLLVSFVAGTVLTMVSSYAARRMGLCDVAPMWINQIVSFVMTWAFFAFIFRFMPDAIVSWRDAAAGGLLTVIIFTIGRMGLYLYLSTSNPAEQLGSAAASLVVILLWVYYSSISTLFGAEFTSLLSGQPATPEPGATRIDGPGN